MTNSWLPFITILIPGLDTTRVTQRVVLEWLFWPEVSLVIRKNGGHFDIHRDPCNRQPWFWTFSGTCVEWFLYISLANNFLSSFVKISLLWTIKLAWHSIWNDPWLPVVRFNVCFVFLIITFEKIIQNKTVSGSLFDPHFSQLEITYVRPATRMSDIKKSLLMHKNLHVIPMRHIMMST